MSGSFLSDVILFACGIEAGYLEGRCTMNAMLDKYEFLFKCYLLRFLYRSGILKK